MQLQSLMQLGRIWTDIYTANTKVSSQNSMSKWVRQRRLQLNLKWKAEQANQCLNMEICSWWITMLTHIWNPRTPSGGVRVIKAIARKSQDKNTIEIHMPTNKYIVILKFICTIRKDKRVRSQALSITRVSIRLQRLQGWITHLVSWTRGKWRNCKSLDWMKIFDRWSTSQQQASRMGALLYLRCHQPSIRETSGRMQESRALMAGFRASKAKPK